MKNHIILVVLALILVACGVDASLTFSTTPGLCANFVTESNGVGIESAPGPYCMQVAVTNNGGGQNFINSTTASISNITMNITGAYNINSPATSASTLDPNNCQLATISPGGDCVFYLQISQESYPVNQAESATLTLTYNVNGSLLGSSNQTGSSSMNFYEITNLYMPETNGIVAILNSSSTPFTTFAALRSGAVNTSSVDTSVFGYLYIGSNNGVYQYGEESISPSIYTSGINGGANNLIYSSSNIYVVNSNGGGTYQWSLNSNSWANGGSAVYGAVAHTNSNVSTVGPSGIIYIAAANQVYNCNNTGSSSNQQSCNKEANSIGAGQTITAMTYTNTNAPNTGLYIGTNYHLYAESTGSTTATNTWTPITGSDGINPIQSQINTMATDSNNNLYIGDDSGTIWRMGVLDRAANRATQMYTLNGGSIQKMMVDTIANTLYFIATSGGISQLYSCDLNGSCSKPEIVPGTQALSSPVVGMNIASELQSSL